MTIGQLHGFRYVAPLHLCFDKATGRPPYRLHIEGLVTFNGDAEQTIRELVPVDDPSIGTVLTDIRRIERPSRYLRPLLQPHDAETLTLPHTVRH